jgi:superfamily II DNA or RNA helicase
VRVGFQTFFRIDRRRERSIDHDNARFGINSYQLSEPRCCGDMMSISILPPAGLVGRIASYFSPKSLKAHVWTEFLANGQVQITPVFTIDGKEVPSHRVKSEPTQTILGYKVTLDKTSVYTHKVTQAEPTLLSKRKAAEFLARLERADIPVRSRDGKARPRVAQVKPDVTLELRPDDSLVVSSEFADEDGIILGKPTNLDQLNEDEGWYAVGDNLLQLPTTGTQLDGILASADGTVLNGDAIPRLLTLIQNHPQAVGQVEKNEPLRGLSVFGERWENRAEISGDAESISVSTSLAFPTSNGGRHEETRDSLKDLSSSGGFRRVVDGWVEVKPWVVGQHDRACEEMDRKLGDVSDLRGVNIPRVLVALTQGARAGVWETPWSVYFSKAVTDSHRIIDTAAVVQFRLDLVESDGLSLLELNPIYNHDRFQVSHTEAEKAVRDDEGWVRREGAWIKADVEKFKEVDDGIERFGLLRARTGFTFPASRREQVVEFFSTLGSIQHLALYTEFLMKLADFEKIDEVELPASLRPDIEFHSYQKHGYNWLAFLRRFGLNGILADDMGLGKTLQCLAAIQHAREISGDNLPSLIICPSTVVGNWESEAYKFFTEISVITDIGADRKSKYREIQGFLKRSNRIVTCPIVVTSYDIARIDHEELGRIRWLYVVVDEGHLIKNPDAERTKTIKTINGRHKLALTGTPIQNNLEELWSLFDFAMPGFLGNRTRFHETYGKNDKINWDAVNGGTTPLKPRIHPFILRRLKCDVASDLPPKTVVERRVELTPKQVALYKQVLESVDCRKLFELDEKGIRRAKFHILAAYPKLRNICNHPELAGLTGKSSPLKCSDSGKLDCLIGLIEEIAESEHRALVFCQSTRMLDIIEQLLDRKQVRFLRLDGSTRSQSRQNLVNKFNHDDSIPCFLISTKAGGIGINLTGADTVIFYDHDWNPANDNQARDRVHRIGQKRRVTVYKLVSKGTIEEKILERQAIKQIMADKIIGSDEEGFKELTPDELKALFRSELS